MDIIASRLYSYADSALKSPVVITVEGRMGIPSCYLSFLTMGGHELRVRQDIKRRDAHGLLIRFSSQDVEVDISADQAKAVEYVTLIQAQVDFVYT